MLLHHSIIKTDNIILLLISANVACESLTDASMADFLELKTSSGNILKSGWQRRWCVIWHNFMYIYESSQGKQFL